MISLFTFVTPPGPCGYLPDREWQLRYEVVSEVTPAEYMERMKAGWRRFGFALFRPVCEACQECRSLRVDVTDFKPDRSQRRAAAANEDVRIEIGTPAVTDAKLRLYDRFHRFQAGHKGWPGHRREDPATYEETFVQHPFPTEEWCYFVGDKLVGVGYVDVLPGGLSAIYFFYDPDERDRSLGTFNVLKVIEAAKRRGEPHAYLGYYIEGCRSSVYKGRFKPNEVLSEDGEWGLLLE
jgi:arginyl-tRNA--protein-N-Asp/Glu arginylyltransferase